MHNTLDALRAHDPSDMYSAIRNFSTQVRDGVALGRNGPTLSTNGIRRVVVLGMGGSAIGGDLFRSYINSFEDRTIDVVVSRGYRPPPVDASTLLVVSSYSGNTEETIEAYEKTYRHAGAILAVTTGGRIGALALERGHPTITPPGGLQPRAALAYGFFPLAYSLAVKAELFGARVRDATERGIKETIAHVATLSDEYGAGPNDSNAAYVLANKLRGCIPVIYSGADLLDAVNLRWRGQFQENAKNLAFGNVLPEMNHNEINGWINPPELARKFAVIFLRDRDDHERVQRRLEITHRIVSEHAGPTAVVESTGETFLARMFSLVHLGDWAS
ncbi:MAG: bifunctional phosphoglucose/phosphomannose isomerase, partial [bacterium]|nr:bifunctional phosphoglucose/phosphomannose isomerase [Candidatus Kapabacteria bacterium]